MNEELAKIHRARSGGIFSEIELGEREVVEMEVKRSKMGLVLIWSGEVLVFLLLTFALVSLAGREWTMLISLNDEAMKYLYLIVVMMYALLLVSGWVGTMVYRANAMTITNKRVIQKTTTALFARSMNVIELSSIEDVSISEKSVFDRIFRMGTLRLATVGDETTYTMSYVNVGEANIKKIAKLVHEAKNRKRKKKPE